MNKIYKTNMTADYIPYWSIAKGIGEITQNMLDNGEDSFSYSVDPEKGEVIIHSRDVTLPPKALLMGYTTKRDNPDARGCHGSGLKQSLCVLCAKGVKVEIVNGDKVWTPSFAYNEDYQADTLQVEETDYLTQTNSLSFKISGVPYEDIEELISRIMIFQEHKPVLFEDDRGNQVLEEDKGVIYVGGIYVMKSELSHSYNFHPSQLKLNQDRESVSSFDLKYKTSEVWKKHAPDEQLKLALTKNYTDISFESSFYRSSSENDVNEQLAQSFVEESGEALITDSYSEYEAKLEEGMSKDSIKYVANPQIVKYISESNLYQGYSEGIISAHEESIAEEVISPDEVVRETAEEVLSLLWEEGVCSTVCDRIAYVLGELENKACNWQEK